MCLVHNKALCATPPGPLHPHSKADRQRGHTLCEHDLALWGERGSGAWRTRDPLRLPLIDLRSPFSLGFSLRGDRRTRQETSLKRWARGPVPSAHPGT